MFSKRSSHQQRVNLDSSPWQGWRDNVLDIHLGRNLWKRER